MFSSDWDNGDGIERQSRIRVYSGGGTFQVIKAEDQSPLGGFHSIDDTFARMGYAEGSQTYGTVYTDVDNAILEIIDSGTRVSLGSSSAQIFYKQGTADEQGFTFGVNTKHYGSWDDFITASSTQGIFTGTVDAGSGTSALTLSYGPTMASQLIPIVAIRDDISHSFNISASDTSSFTTEISPAGSGVWALYFWCWRLG
jgi:hypothetical protein